MSELDAYLGPRSTAQQPPLASERRRLGVVVGGSLSSGLRVRLDSGVTTEDLAVGRYVIIAGLSGRRFFSIVSDIALDSSNPALERTPIDTDDPFIAEIYRSTITFGLLNVAPMLVIEDEDDEPRPVKTVPAHFTTVFEANEADVFAVFGGEDDQHFHIGTPLDMAEVKVNLDLTRFVERSSGVFGKSGTGKSFITRTLLAGVLKRKVASCLIFDMHNDYGWSVTNEQQREFKGLKQLFPSKVSVISLDPQTSRQRGSKTDGELQIQYDQIDPEDVEMLQGVLGLSEAQIGTLYYLSRRLGSNWLQQLITEDDDAREQLDELIESGTIVKGTVGAIFRKFEFFRRLDFVRPNVSQDVVTQIFEKLRNGTSVVLEFGRWGDNEAAYIFVANYLTRRIHQRYVEAKNKAAGRTGEEPNPLMIVVEEAHKFLTPAIAQHTIFGIIARELRKYNVTLLIVDQRPSGIDDEVMSQVGTRVTCLLDNEADIRAVFSGVSGAGPLREVLARLDSRQQALIMGHAVPMPVVVRTRDYDQTLYDEVGFAGNGDRDSARENIDLLYGE